jgi:hypothetical protein
MEHNSNGHTNGHSNGHIPDVGPRPYQGAGIDRYPPCDLDAERGVLGSILIDELVLIDVMEILTITDFWREAHQVAYQAILDLFERGEPIDGITFSAELRQMGRWEELGENDFLTEIVEKTPYSFNAKSYASIVKELSNRRALDAAQAENIRERDSNRFTAAELTTRHLDRLAALEQSIGIQEEDGNVHPLPEKMDPAAFYGVAGKIVHVVESETEACAEALLLQFLTILGVAMGPKPHFQILGTRHGTKLFVCLTGATGVGRKGSGFDAMEWLIKQCHATWMKPVRGLVSGEGMIAAADKRRGPTLCLETEFGGTLNVMSRQSNTLDAVVKQAWDGRYLEVSTKKDKLEYDDAHVGFCAHVTYEELRQKLRPDSLYNGFGNRFLYGHSYRSKYLPKGGSASAIRQALDPLVREVSDCLQFATGNKDLDIPYMRDEEAEALWDSLYRELSSPRPGLYGAATSRRAPFVLRIAMIFAVMDREFYICTKHLKAALAVWDYCDRTAAYIWGSPRLEGDLGKLIKFVADAKEAGVTRTDINRKCFKGKLRPHELDALLQQAQALGQIVYRVVKTRGADRHEWVYSGGGPFAKKG